MESTTNIFDVLIALGPPVIVAIVSWVSVRASYNKQRRDNSKDLRLKRIERLYKDLLDIHGEIISAKEKFEKQSMFSLKSTKLEKIIKNIELLNIDVNLYFKIGNIDLLSIKALALLNMMTSDGVISPDRKVLSDAEIEEDDGKKYVIVPNSFDIAYFEYEEIKRDIEEKIIKLAKKEIK